MKKILTLLFGSLLLFSSCSDYDDVALWNKSQDMDTRLTSLEELCKQMNTNISSLQTIINALQNNDYVKSVTPVMQNGKEIGYTIAFTKSSPITIYHGQNGKDGADGVNGQDGKDGLNGADGHTPIIGVRQDTDGIFYWTLDGDWLLDSSGNKVKAEGRDGKDGQDGADGKDGQDGINGSDGKDGQDGQDGLPGADGQDGKDGITPQLKIENGYWFVSTDNGSTWTNLGKATGENGKDGVNGADGKDGKDGDSFFQNVDTSNSEYVVFTLADGTEIKLPTWYAFEQLRTLCNQMNTNINALQTIVTALQENDYVKSVTPVMQDGKEIGYTITFSKSNPITIYHGKDGKDGQDGADGTNGKDGADGATPQIGVKQDADGIYYWTLNGEWLLDNAGNKIKAQGTDGKDGQNGSDGQDGQDGLPGADGQDGKDGITPQLKIENGYWFVSTDNGSTWANLGKATGENGKDGADGTNGKDGQDGKDGADGDSFFQNVDTSNLEYVVFTLADGTEIKLPTWYAFEQLRTLCNQMNTNISSLQTIINALQNNDYVKSVTPVMQDGKEIGYTITFSKSNPITIYHGKDGKDGQDGADGTNGKDGNDGVNGQDGKDGHTPIIGVRQDTDGVFYWTLDGDWLLDSSGNKVKAEGRDGKDGQDGANGSDGQDGADGQPGADGQDGKDGITPQLKIENGYWFVSTDNGSTWTNLGKATGENGKDGADGTNGKDGDSMFKSVTQDDNNVYLTLADETVITLPKFGSLTITFSQQTDILIRLGKSATVTYTIHGGGDNPAVEVMPSDGWSAAVTPQNSTSGSITVTCPQAETENRKAIVLVSDGKGRTSMAALTFVYDNSEDLTEELYIPDPNFKAYLLTEVDMDGDGILTKADAKAWNERPWGGNFILFDIIIRSLDGIQYFTALDFLSCYANQLTDLDVSKNTALRLLLCSNNQLTSLDVSKNTTLTSLTCSSNRLTTLDVSKNTALTELECSSNRLTTLDVSKNTALTELECSYNQLTTLDVSKNTTLTSLTCGSNQLTSLDVSKNTTLTSLTCGSNQLTSLDVSKNTALKLLACSNNQLTTLDVSKNTELTSLNCDFNQLTTLDVSKTNIGNSTESHPLSCLSSTLQTLYLKTGWKIDGINVRRSTDYISEQTEILYKD